MSGLNVRAKMDVAEVLSNTYSDTVKFQCVMGRKTAKGDWIQTTPEQNQEDNTFAKATPAGKMELTIDNPALKGYFKPGKRYYVDITEVPEGM